MTMRLLIALLYALLIPAEVLAQKTKAQLNTEIGVNCPDNTTGQCTPALLRQTQSDTVASMQQATAVRSVVSTTDTMLVTDFGLLVTYNNASPIAVTLPQATGSFANWNAYVRNIGAGNVTITPTTSTINGSSSVVLSQGQSLFIVSDGTNYQVWNFAAVAGGARTVLASPTQFNFSLATGNDNTGNGSIGSPWRHLQYAYSFVQQHYDVGGQTVTFKSVDNVGTYPDCFLASGPLVGSLGPGAVIIDMNGTKVEGASTSNCNNGNPYSFGANFGGGFVLQNVTMSVCGTWNQDMVNIGQGSTVFINPGVTYECAFFPWNHNSVNGSLFINSNWTIQARNVSTTGSWTNGGNVVTVASGANIRTFYGATGTGIPADCFVAIVAGTSITFARDINATTQSCSFTSTQTSQPITFNSGGTSHWGIGNFGLVVCQNNNVPNVINSFVQGTPFFYQAFVYALQLSQINCGGVTFEGGTSAGPPFLSQGLSLVYTHGMGVPYFPGSGYNQALTVAVTAGSTSATLSAGGQTYVTNGAAISDLATATGCTTTLSSTAVTGCTGATNCFAGDTIVNTAGVANGTTITSVSAPTINISPAAIGSAGSVTVICNNHYIANGTVIAAGGSGTAITLSQPALVTNAALPVTIGGLTQFGGQYQ